MGATALPTRLTAPALFKGRGNFLSYDALLHAAPLLGVFALAVYVNWPTLNDYFHGDDYIAFVDMVTKPMWKHFGEVFTFKDSNFYWRPLGEVYYFVIWKLFGFDEVAFHLANLSLFLVTLTLLYVFCIQAGFGRLVGIAACAFLTLFPNHVVSVAWITNGPRLLAVAFALGSLVLMQRSIATRRWYLEVLSFLSFVLAALADETALSLAPLAPAYALAFDHEGRGWLRRLVLRTLPYAALGAALTPLQFMKSAAQPGFDSIRIGWHMPEHFWALTSKLVLPTKDSVTFTEMAPEQWTAGGVAIGLAAVALLFGSNRLRFLVLWVALGIAPFTIWKAPLVPARYVYMGAVPFAVVVAWTGAASFEWLRRTYPGMLVRRNSIASGLALALLAAPLIYFGQSGVSATRERDARFGWEAETYRVLAQGLTEAAPKVPQGARIVIYYGTWTGLSVWPDALARTLYRDPTVRVVNVPRGQVDTVSGSQGPKDVVLFFTGKSFIRSAPVKATAGK